MAILFSFLSNISDILEVYYGLSTGNAGLVLGFVPVLGVMGMLTSYLLVEKISMIELLRIIWSVSAIPSFWAILLLYISNQYVEDKNFWMFPAACAIVVFKQFSSGPSLRALGLQEFKDISGLAAGTSALFISVIPASISSLVDHYYDGTPRVPVLSVIGLEVCVIFIFWLMLGIPGLPRY